ncbi:phytanoyl-CoA dioxygenase [Paenibacillus sambharensis]|uniref:Phytanoyl-CoA dioxygenase n=1 Tax=Paenibacillus sambharensis TaxID=1803190 RepID=A0A2W1LZ97_9BACL|nr:phytanoyl-CoA dioxygenase family protein [Paenibacillus sambharensis]PZD96837.1 phytanoyl-CoA dioxygenase [Paenibacillus sambharensis]
MQAALPPLSETYALTEDQLTSYRRDGHIMLRQVVTPDELDVYYPHIHRYVSTHDLEHVPEEERHYYGVERAFPTVMNMWERDETIRRFTFARRFAEIAANLTGVDGIRLYHDSCIFLPPGGHAIPWHTDSAYMLPIDPDLTITMWMALRDIPDAIGSMGFVSGSQEVEDANVLNTARAGMPLVSYGPMKAGDATFHTGLTLHYAPPNRTKDVVREVLTVIYIADRVHIMAPAENEAKEFRDYHLKRLFPGCKAGDPARSEFTPLVYSRDEGEEKL